MSKQIDERVVEMRFDNAQVEKNVSTTMSTLDQFKQKLNFRGAGKGLEEIGAAAQKVDMRGLGNGIEEVRMKFSALQVMGVTALANITNSALNAGKRIASALTIDPVKTGFQEYETKMNAIQVIKANTRGKNTMDEIVAALDDLNTYADKTIYNFAQMTSNIGKFTAQGLDVKKATEASNEMIHQDVEVSKKAGEDTINATKKIDEISKTISSSIADIQTAIVTNAQNITEYTKDSDVKTRKEISELLTPLQQVPEQLSSLQSIVDSSFLSVNTTLSTIVSKVDTIAKNTKQISTLDTKLSNLRTDVDAQKSVIGQIQTDSKAIKVMLVISLIINACVALGVVLLVASKFKLI